MAPKVNTEDLVGAAEVARILGLSHHNSVSTYLRRYDHFPRPVVDLSESRIRLWLRQDIHRWKKYRQTWPIDDRPRVRRSDRPATLAEPAGAGPARDRFMMQVPVEPSAWARARAATWHNSPRPSHIDALCGQIPSGALPADVEVAAMTRLRHEAHARTLGNGMCTRPAELDWRMETVWDTCAYFATGLEFVPVLLRRRDRARERDQTDRADLFGTLIERPNDALDTDHPDAG